MAPSRLTLSRPFKFADVDYAIVEIDEPTVGGVEAFERAKAAGESDTAATIQMLSVELGWPVDAVRKIRTSDMMKISEALAPFVAPAADGGSPGAQ